MKKRVITITLILAGILFSVNIIKAQEQFLWAYSAGAALGWEEAGGMARDNSGNIYIIGTFQDKITFGSVNVVSSGGSDIIVAKFSPAGTLTWARKVGIGTTFGGNETGKAIAVNSSGNSITILGTYSNNSDSLSFLTNGSIKIPPSSGGQDLFVAQLDANGAVQWAEKIGGSGHEDAGAVAYFSNGDFIVAGTYNVDINIGSNNYVSQGNDDIFIVKYNSNRTQAWSLTTGNGINNISVSDLKVRSNGDFYFGGELRGSADFDSNTITSNGESDAYLAKYDSTGAYIFAVNMGGSLNDGLTKIFIDNFNQTYVSGFYSGSNVSIGSTNLTAATNTDIFFVKMNSNDSILFAKTANGNGNNMPNGLYVAGTGANKKIYLSGTFENVLNFGISTATNNPEQRASLGQKDVFLAYYDSLGNVISSARAGGLNNETNVGIVADNSNNMFIYGSYRAQAGFSPFSLTVSGGSDLYIARYGLNTTGISEAANNKTMQVYPNPSNGMVTINFSDAADYIVKIYDVRGVCVINESISTLKSQLDLSHLSNGVYFLNASGADKNFQQKLIIQK
ncbi:MAG: T9SS type A sorting domain-containing protein [Bacteroidia bacterium]